MRRKRVCEICREPAATSSIIEDGSRRVVLCAAHADSAQRAGATSLEALRALFVESGGRRALLPRRAAHERRLFPPRPEGRRCKPGRRSSDGGGGRAAGPASSDAGA